MFVILMLLVGCGEAPESVSSETVLMTTARAHCADGEALLLLDHDPTAAALTVRACQDGRGICRSASWEAHPMTTDGYPLIVECDDSEHVEYTSIRPGHPLE